MAANCLIYRRCRANAINKPLHREDSFDATAFQRSCRDPTRIPKEKHTAFLFFFPLPFISFRFIPVIFNNPRFRLRSTYIPVASFPPRSAIFADGCWSAKFGRDEFARKVKLEKRNDRSPQSNILSLKVYKSPECIYTFRKCIFCTYLHYGREYLRENGYENGRRIL